MAPPILGRRCCLRLLAFSCRMYSTATRSPPPPLKDRLLQYLYTRFYDVETIVGWSRAIKNWNLRKKNAYYGYTKSLHGEYIAAAYYILSQKGGIRFAGHEKWFRADKRGKFSWDFLNFKDVPIEAIDASDCLMNYNGMDNIVRLKGLKYLYLNQCPHIDDWCLSRLYVFQDTLAELSLAGCPQITERGLAALHHLRNLKRLDVSDLHRVANKGLVCILLEEVLPQCEIIGMSYEDGLTMDCRQKNNTDEKERTSSAAEQGM